MSILLALVLATLPGTGGVGGLSVATQAPVRVQAQERLVIQKDGGPGHGPDQPYSVREQGAKDLEGFLGGKYIVFEGGYDFVLLAVIVVLVVVLIIVL